MMLSWFKSLSKIKPLPRKTMELQANLQAIGGLPMHGEAEFETYENGEWEFETEVDFRNGSPAEPLTVYMKGRPIMSLRAEYDESEGKLSSRRGDILSVTPEEGMPIEVKRGGQTVLAGQFERHPKFA
ncbi:MAG: hypothetical protein AAGA72_01510 [Pseudomonadota bacterium]